MLDTPLARAERARIGGDSELIRSWTVVRTLPSDLISDWTPVLEADPERVSWSLQMSRAGGGARGLLGWLEVEIGPRRVRAQQYESLQLHAEGQILRVDVAYDLHLAVAGVRARYHAVSLEDETEVGVGIMAVRRMRALPGGEGE